MRTPSTNTNRSLHLDLGAPTGHLLLTRSARPLLRAAVEPGGGRLGAFRPKQVSFAPGRRMRVVYDASVVWGTSNSSEEALVASHDAAGPPDGSLVVEGDGVRIGVWRWPFDPNLPGLQVACDPDAVAELIEDLGGAPGAVALRALSYRPCRRAVIEAVSGTQRLYLKVVRPRRARRLYDIHRLLCESDVPVPRAFGLSERLGIVVLEARPGRTLGNDLVAGRPLPGAPQLIDLLDRLGRVDVAGRPLSVADHLDEYVPLMVALLPEHERRIVRLAESLRGFPETAVVVAHNDFYDAQVLLDSGAITGLLDVDDAGPGVRADDLANFLAHLDALAVWQPHARPAVERYRGQIVAELAGVLDRQDLERRAAVFLLGLATGPFRQQRPAWKGEALELLRAAERAGGRA